MLERFGGLSGCTGEISVKEMSNIIHENHGTAPEHIEMVKKENLTENDEIELAGFGGWTQKWIVFKKVNQALVLKDKYSEQIRTMPFSELPEKVATFRSMQDTVGRDLMRALHDVYLFRQEKEARQSPVLALSFPDQTLRLRNAHA